MATAITTPKNLHVSIKALSMRFDLLNSPEAIYRVANGIRNLLRVRYWITFGLQIGSNRTSSKKG